MTSCMVMSRKGHVKNIYHIFAFLKRKYNSEMVFGPSEPEIYETILGKQYWNDTLYGKFL